MARQLSGMSGTPVPTVILSETARILEKCVSLTKPLNYSQARTRVSRNVGIRNRTLYSKSQSRDWRKRGTPIVSFNKAGAGWFIDKSNFIPGKGRSAPKKMIGDKSFHSMTEFFHWSSTRWNAYQKYLAELKTKQVNEKDELASVGVTKKSWLQIADALGIILNIPSYVRSAHNTGGRSFQNGKGIKVAEPQRFFVQLSNNNPILVDKIDGASILQRAIDGRLEYFQRNLALAVFDDLKARARAYKGIFVS